MAKKTIYAMLVIFLFLELNFLAHSLIETRYIKQTLARGDVLSNTNFLGAFYCVLPAWLSYGLILSALVGGYFLGQYWWRVVYVEKRHWRFKKTNIKN